MNEEKDFGFKDKEIEKVTANITKADKREFGASFKDALSGIETPDRDAAAANPDGPSPQPFTPSTPAPAQTPDMSATGDTPSKKLFDSSELTDAQKELYEITKPLQTYERDVAETIREQHESVASINLAARKKNEETKVAAPKSERVAQKGLFFLISVILFFAGAGIIATVYYFYSSRETPVTIISGTIITINEKRSLDVTGKTSAETISEIQKSIESPGAQNGLVGIELTEKVVAAADSKIQEDNTNIISSEKLFEIFAPNAPTSLGRSLGSDWLFGFQTLSVNNSANSNEPFILTRVDSFENAFDGMLRWEGTMAKNLGQIFIKNRAEIAATNSTTNPATNSNGSTSGSAIATSSATTTPATPIIPTINTKFEDLVIRNKDVRALKDSAGNIILLYSFLDPKNLLITTNEKTFQEILDRFFSSQVVR